MKHNLKSAIALLALIAMIISVLALFGCKNEQADAPESMWTVPVCKRPAMHSHRSRRSPISSRVSGTGSQDLRNLLPNRERNPKPAPVLYLLELRTKSRQSKNGHIPQRNALPVLHLEAAAPSTANGFSHLRDNLLNTIYHGR